MPFGTMKMRIRDRDRDQSGDNVVQLPECNLRYSFLFDGEHKLLRRLELLGRPIAYVSKEVASDLLGARGCDRKYLSKFKIFLLQ